MPLALLALAAGMLSLRFTPSLPPLWLLACLVAGGCLLLLGRAYALGLFALGFCWACWNAAQALQDQLQPELDGRTLWLEGQVVGLPEVSEGVTRFELAQPRSRRAELPDKIRLSWYGAPKIASGEIWRVAARLKRPHGSVNPQAFDYEAWLLAQRIGATGSVKAGERLAAVSSFSSWRDQLRQRILATPAWGREAGLVALVLGDGAGISQADWQLLQDTGTVHLMVISGQHIALLAGLAYALIAGLARLGLWPARLSWLPWACAASFAVALGYGWLAGFEVPVQRACLMLGLVLLWRLRFRHVGLALPLLFAVNLVLLVEPLVVLQPGFWLSFAAVAVLSWVFAKRLGAWTIWRAWGRAQWTLALGLLPFLVALGLPLSPSGPLANLIAVPWVGWVVVPLALLGSLLLPLGSIGEWLLWLAGAALAGLFRLLAELAAWLPAWSAPQLPVSALVLLGLGCVLCLLPAGVPLRAPALVLLLCLFFAGPKAPPPGYADIWMLDVGQGQAFLLRTQNHVLLYDAGPSHAQFDTAQRVLLPSLWRLGVRHLDILLLSHADQDHAGGAATLLRHLPPRQGVVAGDMQRMPEAFDAQPCEHLAAWEWDQVRFQTYWWDKAKDGNQASCVLRVEAQGEQLLLTGDIDQQAERALLRSGLQGPVDWLVAPHHGSKTSSSVAFLEALRPKAVLLSRGRHNPFNHPHPQVLARYQQRAITRYDSAETGAVKISLGRFVEPQVLRKEPRFWREK